MRKRVEEKKYVLVCSIYENIRRKKLSFTVLKVSTIL